MSTAAILHAMKTLTPGRRRILDAAVAVARSGADPTVEAVARRLRVKGQRVNDAAQDLRACGLWPGSSQFSADRLPDPDAGAIDPRLATLRPLALKILAFAERSGSVPTAEAIAERFGIHAWAAERHVAELTRRGLGPWANVRGGWRSWRPKDSDERAMVYRLSTVR